MIDANSRHTDANTTLTLSRVMCYSPRKTIRGLQNGRTRLYGARGFDRGAVHSGIAGDRGFVLGVAHSIKGASAQVSHDR